MLDLGPMDYRTILVERRAAVARVTLNRPDVRNAFDDTLIAETTDAFTALGGDPAVRAIVLTGSGPIFCAGADVNWMKRSISYTEAQNKDDALRMSGMFRAIDENPKPVIGRINGDSFGGGMGLMACCDIVVAVEGIRCTFSEVKLGIVPAVISAYVAPRIGRSFARRYFLTAELFGPDEARRMGLVHEIVKPDQLDTKVEEIAGTLLKNGPNAVTLAKQLIPEVLGRTRAEAIEYTTSLISRVRTSPEGQEGLGAFLEKRKPSWLR